ncbi:hypothetical protein FOA52_012610 [Chlamydomonas sp. UWO 241]|nr:hypothetical protein FOA52_012610 [Chlamydomonas sp. UWO 241]
MLYAVQDQIQTSHQGCTRLGHAPEWASQSTFTLDGIDLLLPVALPGKKKGAYLCPLHVADERMLQRAAAAAPQQQLLVAAAAAAAAAAVVAAAAADDAAATAAAAAAAAAAGVAAAAADAGPAAAGAAAGAPPPDAAAAAGGAGAAPAGQPPAPLDAPAAAGGAAAAPAGQPPMPAVPPPPAAGALQPLHSAWTTDELGPDEPLFLAMVHLSMTGGVRRTRGNAVKLPSAGAAGTTKEVQMAELWRRAAVVYGVAVPSSSGVVAVTPEALARWYRGINETVKTPRGGMRYNAQQALQEAVRRIVGARLVDALGAVTGQGTLSEEHKAAVRGAAVAAEDAVRLAELVDRPLSDFDGAHGRSAAMQNAFASDALLYGDESVKPWWAIHADGTPGSHGSADVELVFASGKRAHEQKVHVRVPLDTCVPVVVVDDKDLSPQPPWVAAVLTGGPDGCALASCAELAMLLGTVANSRPCRCIWEGSGAAAATLMMCSREKQLPPGVRHTVLGKSDVPDEFSAHSCCKLIDPMSEHMARCHSCWDLGRRGVAHAQDIASDAWSASPTPEEGARADELQREVNQLKGQADALQGEHSKLQQVVEASRASGMVAPRLERDRDDLLAVLDSEAVRKKLLAVPLWSAYMVDQGRYANLERSQNMQWHPAVIHAALDLYLKSSQAYEQLRSSGLMFLPSGRQLRRYKAAAGAKPGWQPSVIDHMFCALLDGRVLADMPPAEFTGGLAFDEMTIASGLVWDRTTGKLRGWNSCGSYGEHAALAPLGGADGAEDLAPPPMEELEAARAPHLLEIVFVSAGNPAFRYPVACFLTGGLSVTQLLAMITDGITQLALHEPQPLTVLWTVCDGAVVGRAFQRAMHDIEFAKELLRNLGLTDVRYAHGYMSVMRHPVFPWLPIFNLSDVPHIFKKVRNALEKSNNLRHMGVDGNPLRDLRIGGTSLSWVDIEELLAWDQRRTLHVTMLTNESVYLNSLLRMRTHLASIVIRAGAMFAPSNELYSTVDSGPSLLPPSLLSTPPPKKK